MLNFVISLILGAGLDTLYYYLYIKNIKEIKNKRFLLFISIFIGYVTINMILRYNFYLYIVFYVYLFIVIHIFEKGKVTDFFLILFIDVYFLLMSLLCYMIIPNYIVALIINKILLFVPLIKKRNLINLYKKYNVLWNRNKQVKQPIKSLTLRNVSLLILNISILLVDIILIYIMTNG